MVEDNKKKIEKKLKEQGKKLEDGERKTNTVLKLLLSKSIDNLKNKS